jgi:hypothetical protein
MDKKLKNLMFFNLLFYINHFLVIFLANYYGLKDLAALWFFTPVILILFTTSIIESSISGYVKKLSFLDFGLRGIALLVNFIAISGMIELSLTYLIVIGIIFLAVNITLEWLIYKQLDQQQKVEEELLTKKEIEELVEDYAETKSILKDKSPMEKEEIQTSYQSTIFVGYSYAIIFLLVAGGTFAFEFFGEQNRITVLMIAILVLGVYFYITNRKLDYFYKGSNKGKKINLRDNLTFIIGLSIIYLLQGYIHIGTGTINFLGIFLAIVFFLPTIKTNQLIRDYFHKVNKKYIKQ